MVGFGNCKGSRLIRMNKGSVLTACPLQDDSVSVGLGSVSGSDVFPRHDTQRAEPKALKAEISVDGHKHSESAGLRPGLAREPDLCGGRVSKTGASPGILGFLSFQPACPANTWC